MFLLVLRTLVVYVLIVAAMRLNGKSSLRAAALRAGVHHPHLKPCVPVHESPDVPLRHQHADSVSYCCLRNTGLCPVRKVPPGAASRIRAARIVMREGVIDQKRLKELRFTPDDLLEALRAKDIFELSDVALAIVETNGSVSVQRTFEADSTANGALGLKPPKAKLPSLPIIIDGDWADDSLEFLGLTREWALKQLRQKHTALGDVLLFLCNDAGETQLVAKNAQREKTKGGA